MEEKIIACEYCRWARDEMNWKYCPDCGLPTDPLSAFKKVEIPPSQPSEQKPPEGEEPKPWELQIIKNIWRRAYLDSEEDHVKILKDYGQQARNEAIQECIELVIERIRNAGRAEQNGGAEYYPFDSMSLENIVGMRRAYAELKLELETLKHNP